MATITKQTKARRVSHQDKAMGSQQTPPIETIVTTKRGLDLDTFGDVTLYKVIAKPAPVASVEDALHRLGNDHKRLLSILTQGITADAVESARSVDSGWKQIDEDGKQTDTVFSGNLVPEEAAPLVNNLVLSLAKNVFSYNDAKDADGKREAKSQARDFIKSNETMLNGLKANVAALSGAPAGSK